MHELITSFINARQLAGYDEQTIRHYVHVLSEFEIYTASHNIDITAITREQARKYSSDIRFQDLVASTINVIPFCEFFTIS